MSKKILSDLDFLSTSRPINVPDPVGAQDAATKAYVDSAVEGLAWKDSVRVASTANINLASPGATIDGVTMVALDRVLVKNQTTTSENGIYIWNGAASAMTRSNDCSTAAELEQATVTVEEGTSAGSTFRQTTVNFTLGSGAVSFTVFGTSAPAASEATAGIAELATQAETDTGTDDIRIVTPLKLASYANKKLKAVGNIGDGSATQYDITHNFNTRNVQVSVFRNGTPWDDIMCDVSRPDANTVRLNFAAAPSAAQFSHVILG